MVRVLLLDIEGTICPITFVHDTLFPYFLSKVSSILNDLSYPLQSTDDEITATLARFPEQIKASQNTLQKHIEDLVNRDVKDPILKSFQGLVWKYGYESGELSAPLFEDAIKLIKEANSREIPIYIYSSGSVFAQRLLFGHVKDNDRILDYTPYVKGYFDISTAGFKSESSSYHTILEKIGFEKNPQQVLFLSDNTSEVQAALKTSMESFVVFQEGNPPLEQNTTNLRVIKSLDEVKMT